MSVVAILEEAEATLDRMRQKISELANKNPNKLYTKEIETLSSQFDSIVAGIFQKYCSDK